jgi:hypothetical protein
VQRRPGRDADLDCDRGEEERHAGSKDRYDHAVYAIADPGARQAGGKSAWRVVVERLWADGDLRCCHERAPTLIVERRSRSCFDIASGSGA